MTIDGCEFIVPVRFVSWLKGECANFRSYQQYRCALAITCGRYVTFFGPRFLQTFESDERFMGSCMCAVQIDDIVFLHTNRNGPKYIIRNEETGMLVVPSKFQNIGGTSLGIHETGFELGHESGTVYLYDAHTRLLPNDSWQDRHILFSVHAHNGNLPHVSVSFQEANLGRGGKDITDMLAPVYQFGQEIDEIKPSYAEGKMCYKNHCRNYVDKKRVIHYHKCAAIGCDWDFEVDHTKIKVQHEHGFLNTFVGILCSVCFEAYNNIGQLLRDPIGRDHKFCSTNSYYLKRYMGIISFLRLYEVPPGDFVNVYLRWENSGGLKIRMLLPVYYFNVHEYRARPNKTARYKHYLQGSWIKIEIVNPK